MLQNALNINKKNTVITEAGSGEKENTTSESVPGSIATESYVTSANRIDFRPRH